MTRSLALPRRRRPGVVFGVRIAVLLGLLAVAAPLASARFADPDLETIVPRGGRIGTDVEITLQGRRIADAQELIFFRPGLEVLELKGENDRQARAKLRIADDCPLGEHAVVLRTRTGLSEVVTFHVGALTEIQEQEPNGRPDQAQAIPLEVTVNGVVTREDVDLYAIEITEPTVLSLDVAGVRLGDTPFDPHLTVQAPDGETLLVVDDTAFGRLDPLGRLPIEVPGTYRIQVRESAFRGNARSHYRLRVGTFPIVVGAIPAGGRPGTSSLVRFVGLDRSWEQTVSWEGAAGRVREWFVRDENGVAASPVRLVSSRLPVVLEPSRESFEVKASPWKLIGPFPNPPGEGGVGKGHAEVFPPEEELKADAVYPGRDGEVRWVERADFVDGKVHDLTAVVEPADQALVYLWRRLESPIAQHFPITLGTDDTVKVWLNGELLHEHARPRGVQPGQDRVVLPLKQGVNDLLFKVTNGGGAFGFTVQKDRRRVGERAPAVPMPSALHGVIATEGETDLYRFHAEKDRELELVVRARELRSPLDAVHQVRTHEGRGLVANDDSGGPDSRLRFKPPETGDYLLAIWDHLRSGGPRHFYRVEIDRRRGDPGLRVAIPGRPDDFTVSVPRGGRAATLLRLDGLDPRRDIRPFFSGLPEGITVTTGALQRGTSLVPVVFEAAADAALAGAAAEVRARAPDDDEPQRARFAQRLALVKVRNNQTFLETEVDRLPVAVADSPPFTIELAAPTVPIIQGSPLSVKVALARREGFDGPVRVRMLWNPPGLSSGEITFQKDQTELALPLNARGNAREGTWPIAVVGRANAGGTWEVSSQIVPLEVSRPWIRAEIGKTRVEQGAATELAVSFESLREGIESYDARIVNLPREVQTEFPPVAGGQQSRSYALAIGAKAPPGRHRNLLLRCVVPSPGGAVVHHVRGGELRIDEPLPPERKKPPAPAKEAPAPEKGEETKKPASGTLKNPKT